MPKFKSGDRIVLKKDVLSPYGPKAIDYWNNVNLEENKIYEVDIIGTYDFVSKDYLNSVSLKNLNFKGWLPEDIFDLVPMFNEGDLVKTYRQTTHDDFKSFNISIEPVNFSNDSVFRVESVNDNFCIKIDKKSDVYFPPTIFQKIETWCVACNQDMEGNSELLEWRGFTNYKSTWANKGFINDRGMHRTFSPPGFDYTVLTYNEFVKFIYNPWKEKLSIKEETVIQKPLNLTPNKEIVTTCNIGAKVVRGRDWDWGFQDNDSFGIIIEPFKTNGWVQVKWNNGSKNNYRIGVNDKYDLYYYDEPITMLTPYSKELPPDSIKEYDYLVTKSIIINEIPELIIKKSKTKLISTEVKELNVNIHIR